MEGSASQPFRLQPAAKAMGRQDRQRCQPAKASFTGPFEWIVTSKKPRQVCCNWPDALIPQNQASAAAAKRKTTATATPVTPRRHMHPPYDWSPSNPIRQEHLLSIGRTNGTRPMQWSRCGNANVVIQLISTDPIRALKCSEESRRHTTLTISLLALSWIVNPRI